jgi:hypothetical protein
MVGDRTANTRSILKPLAPHTWLFFAGFLCWSFIGDAPDTSSWRNVIDSFGTSGMMWILGYWNCRQQDIEKLGGAP